MIKKIFFSFAFFAATHATNVHAYNSDVELLCPKWPIPVVNGESYTRTQKTVTIYTEDGHNKGTFAVYLHHGKKHINFNNTWICIQGKSRFGYNGNWYVIK